MPLDLKAPLKTRSGRSVRLLATDAGGDFPLVGLIRDPESGNEAACLWTIEGRSKYYQAGDWHGLELVNG